MGPPGDVIAAIATPPGEGGIGIVRLSGADLSRVVAGVLGRTPAPRHASLGAFLDADANPIDQGIALLYPAPHSYTGETVLELQAHGGPAVLSLLLRRCLALGARLAQPGEFTRRAFLNGRMDLAQAESVADLIAASTASAARAAVRSLHGAFSAEIRAIVAELTALRALIEASLDFPEEDIDFVRAADVEPRLVRLRERVSVLSSESRRGVLLRDGLAVALIGAPNVGKSSLLNRLAGEELAIVTAIPGTTRDPVRAHVEVGGIPLRLVDTAGLRETHDPVERIGVERAWREGREADLVLELRDAGADDGTLPDGAGDRLVGVARIIVHNKIDLYGLAPHVEDGPGGREVWLSALRGDGIDGLHSAILAAHGAEREPERAFLARERHVDALERAGRGIEDALRELRSARAPPLELVAESLRDAQAQLGAITGEFTSDALLGEIFGRFCIGK